MKVNRSPFVGTADYDWRENGRFASKSEIGIAREGAEGAKTNTTDITALPSERSAELELVDWFYRGKRQSAELAGSQLLPPVVSPSGLAFDILSELKFDGSEMRIAAPLVPYEHDIAAIFSQVRGNVPIHWVDRTDYIDRFAGEGTVTFDLNPAEHFRPTVEGLLPSGRNIHYAHNAHVRLDMRISYEWNYAENRLESVQLEGDVKIDESWSLQADVASKDKNLIVGVKAVATATWNGTLNSTLSTTAVRE